MKELGPFIETPRSAKRLTNVYRLTFHQGAQDRPRKGGPHPPACLRLPMTSDGYRKRTGASGGGAEKSIGWMSSTFERNQTSNS